RIWRTARCFPRLGVITLPIETERVRVRPVEPERDAEPLFELWGDAEAMRFVRPPSGNVEEAGERLEQLVQWPSGWGMWALDERESGDLVGRAGLFPLAKQGPEIELAYQLVPSRWGRGYARGRGGGPPRGPWAGGGPPHVGTSR